MHTHTHTHTHSMPAFLPPLGRHSWTVAQAAVSVAPYPCATGQSTADMNFWVSPDSGAPPEMRRRTLSRPDTHSHKSVLTRNKFSKSCPYIEEFERDCCLLVLNSVTSTPRYCHLYQYRLSLISIWTSI